MQYSISNQSTNKSTKEPINQLLKKSITQTKSINPHQVERQRVRLTAVAHEGSFGRVFRGWIQRDRPEQDQQVLIKTVTEGAPHDEVVALYREGTHLFNLYHRNVLTMVGISFADNSSPFLLYPFHGYQNLKL